MPLIQVAPGRYIDSDSVVAVTGDQYGNAFVRLLDGKDIKIHNADPADVAELVNDHGLTRKAKSS